MHNEQNDYEAKYTNALNMLQKIKDKLAVGEGLSLQEIEALHAKAKEAKGICMERILKLEDALDDEME